MSLRTRDPLQDLSAANTADEILFVTTLASTAVQGMALGGGCELQLHADAVQAHIESYVGLVRDLQEQLRDLNDRLL